MGNLSDARLDKLTAFNNEVNEIGKLKQRIAELEASQIDFY